MVNNPDAKGHYLSLLQRVVCLFVYTVGLYFAGGLVTGDWKPTGGGEWLWWLSAITLSLFNTLSAPFFVRPRDSLANAITAAVMLFTVDLGPVATLGEELNMFRWAAIALAVVAIIVAVAAIALHGVPASSQSWKGRLGRGAYHGAVAMGHEAVMFTPPALISIVGFHQQRPGVMLWLVSLWMIAVAMRPVELLARLWGDLRGGRAGKAAPEMVGTIDRVDDPNIVRVALTSAASWKHDRLHTARLPGDRHVSVIPLFVQTQNERLIGTGLCCDGSEAAGVGEGQVWTAPEGGCTNDALAGLAGTTGAAALVGFVVEDSSIATVRFEVTNALDLQEGSVVFVRDKDTSVYYQVLDAMTREEVFAANPRGTHVVAAGQLGTREDNGRFRKHGWTPPMNAPVFLLKAASSTPAGADAAGSAAPAESDEFVLGAVAGTGMRVTASLREMAEYHTAILGVTGTGKTELVLDIVRAQVAAGRKVICVDFTGEYRPRLKDLSPTSLGFAASDAQKLEELVNAIEYGQYRSEQEKKNLDDWTNKARPTIDGQIKTFIESNGGGVGVFELPDIANTRATLRATELYLSAVFAWARANRGAREIVIVLEEAHTVIPETVMFGFDKGETQAVVGRISQIALQGRKYGVGLLLVSQRTALVSKTLLSQCNTVVCLAMYDKTGLEYLSSVFSSEHVRAIPNLRFLQGIAFGKAVRSERPIIFEIPDDPRKRAANRSLDATPPGDAPTAPAPDVGTEGPAGSA